MPAKGQSCVNCAGDCCTAVAFIIDNSVNLNAEIMEFSVKKLRKLGFREAKKPHKPCAGKTKYGCLIYEDRPRLCRSYYCHGRHWKPKRVN